MTFVLEPGALAVYFRLLSLGFTAPDERALEELRLLAVLAGKAAEEEGLAEAVGSLELALDDDDLLPELAAEYEALFGGSVRVPPYEGSWESDPIRSSRQMADLEGFYRAFGATSGGPAAERPDHVGCELEFLSFLAARRAEAAAAGDAEHAEVCREAEDGLLRDHLGRWFPAFCREVAVATASPVYRLLALVGERLVVLELARRDIVPSPLAGHRRTAVEADELRCGGGIEAAIAGRDERPPR